jgi:hypothetical protein
MFVLTHTGVCACACLEAYQRVCACMCISMYVHVFLYVNLFASTTASIVKFALFCFGYRECDGVVCAYVHAWALALVRLHA